ncbi:MAG: hypothetical protein AAGI23_20925 [Bacteroidota bacterium]
MPDEQPTIPKGRPPQSDRKALLERLEAEQARTPERVEEAAKYLGAVVSIALTILVGKDLAEWTTETFRAAAVLWLFSAVLSFLVVMPFPYRYGAGSAASIERTFSRVAKVKYGLLVAAVILFLFGLGLAVAGFWQG